MAELKRIRGFYVHATAWDFDNDVQPHIQKMRRIQAEEFDRLLVKVKADAWDEGYADGHSDGQMADRSDYAFHDNYNDDRNPYRKEISHD